MPLFRYEVGDKTGKVMMGAMDASSEDEVRQLLMMKGYKVNSVIPVSAPKPQAMPRQRPTAARATSRISAPPGEMAVFFRSIASYLNSGMSIFEGLSHIATQTPNRGMNRMAQRMAAYVQAGGKLSDVMAEYPRAFPAHVVGVVAAGELGGFLPVVVGDLAFDYELVGQPSKRWGRWLCQAFWINALGTFAIVLGIPRLLSPGVTDFKTAMMKYGNFTLIYVLPPMVLLVIGYHVIAAVLKEPKMRPLAHKLVLRGPRAVAQASKMRSLASFSRILWRLLNAGVLPIQAWDAASRAAENSEIAARLQEQISAIRAGRKFSEALAATGLFRSEDQRILMSAEVSGQLSEVLQSIATYYEDAAQTGVGKVRWFGVRAVVWVNILAIAASIGAIGYFYQNMFKWVDWFMEAGK